MKTQLAPVYVYGEIESYNTGSALAVSMVLLAGSLVTLILLNCIQKWRCRYEEN